MKTIKFLCLITLPAICAGFASCRSGDDGLRPKERQDIPLTKVEESIVQGNNAFGLNLLQTIVEEDRESEEEGNIFVSPLSVTLALGMLNNGAAGSTSEEIRKTLGYDGVSTGEMNDYFLKMLIALKNIDPYVTLESANSIWLRQDFRPLPAFIEVNQSKYDAEVRSEDFADPATLRLINAWCSDKTHGMINEILKQISPDAVMYLINALYFKGAWAEPFDKKETKDDIFTREDGATSTVPMMQKELRLNYVRNDLFQAVEVPYGNEAFSTLFLLPTEGVALSSVVEQLDATAWNDCLANLSGQQVQLGIPRMELEYGITLNSALKKLGIQSVFSDEAADLTGIHPTAPLAVSLIKQNTALKVNEEGTEAAAVTIVGVDIATAPPPDRPVPFILNRPFLFFIKEKSTGAILFEGLIRTL
jgi:serpin B